MEFVIKNVVFNEACDERTIEGWSVNLEEDMRINKIINIKSLVPGKILIYLWLKHIENYTIIETNWKAASESWNLSKENKLKQIIRRMNVYFYKKYGYKIYESKLPLEKSLQQWETSALGISLRENSVSIIAVNYNYYDLELNYDSMEEIMQHIIRKCFISTLCILAYFKDGYNKTIFALPKMSSKNVNVISVCFDEINNILINNEISHSIELITNEDFEARIIQPVLNKILRDKIPEIIRVEGCECETLIVAGEEKLQE